MPFLFTILGCTWCYAPRPYSRPRCCFTNIGLPLRCWCAKNMQCPCTCCSSIGTLDRNHGAGSDSDEFSENHISSFRESVESATLADFEFDPAIMQRLSSLSTSSRNSRTFSAPMHPPQLDPVRPSINRHAIAMAGFSRRPSRGAASSPQEEPTTSVGETDL